MKRIWLAGAAGLLLAVVAGTWYAAQAPGGGVLDLQDAYRQSASGKLVLIDIRRPAEWRATGVAATGLAITMHQDRQAFVRAVGAAAGGDTERRIGLICAAGVRSARMSAFLRQNGFENVFDVSAGMTGGFFGKGWTQAGLPVRKWAGDASPAVSRARPQ